MFEKPHIRCQVRNHGNYYSWVKEEILSTDPWISLIYDVITDREVEEIKSMAIPEVNLISSIAEAGPGILTGGSATEYD